MKNTTQKPESTRWRNPVSEIAAFCARSVARCREKNWGPAAFLFGVAGDIASDCSKRDAELLREAYAAQQEDLEAAKLLEEAARDGLSQCDMPAVARAIRLIKRSARRDGDLAAELVPEEVA